jgi:hypothetical protein
MRLRVLVAAAAAAVGVAGSSEAKHVRRSNVAQVVHRSTLGDWLRARLPRGGEVHERPGLLPEVVHVVQEGETHLDVAAAYLDLTSIYDVRDLARAIGRENKTAHRALEPGTRLTIPNVVTEPVRVGRLPATDEPLRGVYVRGETAGKATYGALLAKVRGAGMNAIVLDAKDYDGWITYPSRVPLANEAGAVKNPPIADLSRAIRFAHERGLRVIMRVSCFNDEHMAKARPKMSVQSKAHRAYPIGWLDPSNEEVQSYIVSLVRESLDAGADEIQLDYVRYPVLGIKNADFHLRERGLTKPIVIRDFVRRVHAVTRARGVPLSLDIFGIVALGHKSDIDSLGQDPAMLAAECEALSPMVYPSHYGSGIWGLEAPGDHPEVVGFATRGVRDQVAGVPHGAAIRPWLQAASWKSKGFGQAYIAREIHAANQAGAEGWLLWNPGQSYDFAWGAVPRRKPAAPRVASR